MFTVFSLESLRMGLRAGTLSFRGIKSLHTLRKNIFPYHKLNVCSFVQLNCCVLWHLSKPTLMSVLLRKGTASFKERRVCRQIALSWLPKDWRRWQPWWTNIHYWSKSYSVSSLSKVLFYLVLGCFVCDCNTKEQREKVFGLLFLMVGTVIISGIFHVVEVLYWDFGNPCMVFCSTVYISHVR